MHCRIAVALSLQLSFACFPASLSHAGPLQQATIHKIVNDVRVVDPSKPSATPAKVEDVIKDDLAVRTGIQSRAELLFQDNTLTRLGAQAIFSFKPGTREMTLDRGTMLLQVPKGLGGAKIHTAAVTAAITGTTIMIEHIPGRHIKVLVLEGSLRLSINGKLGESMVLKPGKMVILGDKDKRLPKPVAVDLEKVVKTSALIDPARFKGTAKIDVAPLPSIALIEKEIAIQGTAKDKSRLAETNLLIDGDGTEVIVASKDTMAALDNVTRNDSTSQVSTSVDVSKTRTDLLQKVASSVVIQESASSRSNSLLTDTVSDVAAVVPRVIRLSPGDLPTDPGSVITPTSPSTPTTPTTPSTPDPVLPAPIDVSSVLPTQIDPTNGPAVFTVPNLDLSVAPTVDTTGGPLDISVVGQLNVSDTGSESPFTWDVGNLNTVVIGSESGAIDLSNAVSFSADSTSAFQTLQFDATGGDITLAGNISLPAADLVIGGTENVVLDTQSVIDASQVLINSAKAVQLDGVITTVNAEISSNDSITIAGNLSTNTLLLKGNTLSLGVNASISGATLSLQTIGDFGSGAAGSTVSATDSLSLLSGGTLTLNTSSSARTKFDIGNVSTLQVEAQELIIPNSITLSAATTGSLKARSGGIKAAGFDLLGFDSISSEKGDVAVRNLDARSVSTTQGGNLIVSGNLSTHNASIDGALRVAGAITPMSGDTPATNHLISARSIESGGGLNFKGADAGLLLSAPAAGGSLILNSTSADLKFGSGSGAIAGASFDGGSAAGLLNFTEGGNGGTLQVGTDTRPTAGKVIVATPISATTGTNGTLVSTGGKGGTINIVSADSIDIQSQVKVSSDSGNAKSKQGGNIRLDSRKISGTAINVSNSGQLYSLLSAAAPGPGGTVEFISAGGDIKMDGGSVRADKGVITIQNNGLGNVELKNAILHGDVVKANVLGPNGQLIISGGTIDADSAIKLYASGANGSVLFKDNTTLDGNSVKTIAGNTVTIENGKVVTVKGNSPATVHTNNANYTGSGGNGSKTGTFGGKGATTKPFNTRPAF